MELKPSEIYFSQAEINNVFNQRSCHRYKHIGETLDELVEGRCSIADIPTISVVWKNEKWVTVDNRRLWVFRHLEKLGKCTTIWVNPTSIIDPRKLDSTNGGRTVIFHPGRVSSGKWHHRVASIDPYQFTSNQPANRTHYSNTCSVPSVLPSNQLGTTELYRRPSSSSISMPHVSDSSELTRHMRSLHLTLTEIIRNLIHLTYVILKVI